MPPDPARRSVHRAPVQGAAALINHFGASRFLGEVPMRDQTLADARRALLLQARELKEVVAEQALELRLLKKSMIADGGDDA